MTLTTIAPNLVDSDLVNFGSSARNIVHGPYGRSYWFRWGDIKHLGLSQMQAVVGELAMAGQSGGAKFIRVAVSSACDWSVGGNRCKWEEGREMSLTFGDNYSCKWEEVPSIASYVEYVAKSPVNIAICVPVP
jgi:hypothetical protein